MSIFYMDYVNGLDATTATPLGWWSVAYTGGSVTAPVASELVTGAISGSTARLTVVVAPTSGTWAGNNAAGTMYFYGKSAAFQAEQVNCAGGGHFDIAADFVYCAWKTTSLGATAARIAPGDIIRIAKSAAPSSIGNGIWTGTTIAGGGFPTTVAITSSTNATPIVITKAGHGLSNGDVAQIVGHTSNASANGAWVIANVTANTFELVGSVGIGVGGAVGTYQKINSKAVILTTAGTVSVDRCEVAWTAAAGSDATVTLTPVTTDAKEGGSCMKILMDAAVQANILQAYYATGTLDLSGYQKLSFWIKNSAATLATHWVINLCSDVAGITTVDSFVLPAIPSINRWIPLTITRSGGGNLGASIKSIAIYSGSVAPTNSSNVLIDNFVVCTTNGINLQSLISKNSAGQGGTEGWYAIQSINGTVILLDTDTNTKSNAGRGYSTSGTNPETVTTYIRETIKTDLVSSSTTTAQEIMDSGSTGNNIQFQGGYDITLNTQIGETFFDGLNGNGYGIFFDVKSYITLNYLNIYRYNYGIYYNYNSIGNTITTISNVNNNTTYGINYNNNSNGNTITTISNANNNSYGIFYYNSNNNTITTVTNANNNANYGIHYKNISNNNTITTVTNANNNANYGIYYESSSNSNAITTVTNANNNTNYGIYYDSSNNNTITTVTNANNNNIAGIAYTNSNNNKIFSLSTTGNTTGGIYNNTGQNYISHAVLAEATEVSGMVSFANSKLFSTNHDGGTNHWIFTDGGTINSAATNRPGGTGLMWKFAINSSNRSSKYPLTLSVAKIAVAANKAVTVKAWMKKDHATAVVGKLVCRGGQLTGVTSDVTVTKANDTNWEELTLADFTPTEIGVIEIEAWAEYSTGLSNIYVSEMTITQAA